MKRLSIITIMLICIVIAGCSKKSEVSEVSKEKPKVSEVSEEKPKENAIHAEEYEKGKIDVEADPFILTKYSDKELVVYSDTSCNFRVSVDILDGDFEFSNFVELNISANETLNLTPNDIVPDFFSEEAKFTCVAYFGNSYNGDYEYTTIDDGEILAKYSADEIIIYSSVNQSCFTDFSMDIVDGDFIFRNCIHKVKIEPNANVHIKLDDLIPNNFLSKSAEITDFELSGKTYIKR